MGLRPAADRCSRCSRSCSRCSNSCSNNNSTSSTSSTSSMFGRRFEGGKSASHHRPSLLSRQEQEEDAQLAAAERKELAARKFDEWVRFKDSFDRGLGLFAKLDPSHCEVRYTRVQCIASCHTGSFREFSQNCVQRRSLVGAYTKYCQILLVQVSVIRS